MSSNSTSINITACDNQLLMYATQWGYSYPIVSFSSGNSKPVDVTVTIVEGNFTLGYNGNNVNGEPYSSSGVVYLPSGDYQLNCIGINWGGPYEYAFSVTTSGVATSYGTSPSGVITPPSGATDVGIFWSTGTAPIPITVE